MKYGVTFPQNEIGRDPAVIREYAQTADQAGFDYLGIFDHVVGAHPDRFVGRDVGFPAPPYVHTHEFHEVFSVLSYIAALTERIELTTAILILPQRQTALVAKQASTLSILSGGRFRMGVGIGWNFTEFEAQNEDFHNRGKRVEEQIVVLRKLWSEPLVTFEGRWHHLDRVGIAPLPSAPIPIWMGGGTTDRLLRRVARYADGWMPGLRGPDEAAPLMGQVHQYMEEAGRNPAAFGLQAGLNAANGEPADWVRTAKAWRDAGATHLGIRGTAPGLTAMQGLQQAVEARRLLASELG